MRRLFVALALAALMVTAAVMPVAAHAAPPCNDANGDGSPSGQEYAAHHIVSLAKAGGLGDGGHKPGSHQGFSKCLGVHD